MDDYHEFGHAHEIQIEEWRLYCFPNYVYIIVGIMAPSGTMITFCISLASGNGNAIGSGTIGSGGTIGGGDARASITMPIIEH
jgi:hypothetical protein